MGWIDLGDAIVLVPDGLRRLRREHADWTGAEAGFSDTYLANQ